SRIIAVFGCGGDRDVSKRPKMGAIAAKLSDYVIVTSDNPRSEDPIAIIEQIVAGIEDSKKSTIEIEPNRSKAIEKGLKLAKSGDLVLIAGKGHEAYQIIGEDRLHFDDREEVLKFTRNI